MSTTCLYKMEVIQKPKYEKKKKKKKKKKIIRSHFFILIKKIKI